MAPTRAQPVTGGRVLVAVRPPDRALRRARRARVATGAPRGRAPCRRLTIALRHRLSPAEPRR